MVQISLFEVYVLYWYWYDEQIVDRHWIHYLTRHARVVWLFVYRPLLDVVLLLWLSNEQAPTPLTTFITCYLFVKGFFYEFYQRDIIIVIGMNFSIR